MMESTRSEEVHRFTLPQTYLLRSSSVEQSRTPNMHNIVSQPVLLRARKASCRTVQYTPILDQV